jgi:hypothetical protein
LEKGISHGTPFYKQSCWVLPLNPVENSQGDKMSEIAKINRDNEICNLYGI